MKGVLVDTTHISPMSLSLSSMINKALCALLSSTMLIGQIVGAEDTKARVITYQPPSKQQPQGRIGLMSFAPALTFEWTQARLYTPFSNQSNNKARILERPSYWLVLLDISDTNRVGGIISEINTLISFVRDLPSTHMIKLVPFAHHTYLPNMGEVTGAEGYIRLDTQREKLINWLENYKRNENWKKEKFYHNPDQIHPLLDLNQTHIAGRVSESISAFINTDLSKQSLTPAAYKVLLLTDAKDEDRQNEQYRISGLSPYEVRGRISPGMQTQTEFYIISEASYVRAKDRSTARNEKKFQRIAQSCEGHLYFNPGNGLTNDSSVREDSNRAAILSELAGRYLSSGKIAELDFGQLELAAYCDFVFQEFNHKLRQSPFSSITPVKLHEIAKSIMEKRPYSIKLDLLGNDGQRARTTLNTEQIINLLYHILETPESSAEIKMQIRRYLILYYCSVNKFTEVKKLLVNVENIINNELTIIIEIIINAPQQWGQGTGWEIFKLAMMLVEGELKYEQGEKAEERIGNQYAAACFYYAQILSGETVNQVKVTKVDLAQAIRLMTYSLHSLKAKHPELTEQAFSFLMAQFELQLRANASLDEASLIRLSEQHSDAYWILARYYLSIAPLTQEKLDQAAQALRYYLLGQAQKPRIQLSDEHKHAYSLLLLLGISHEFLSPDQRESRLSNLAHIIKIDELLKYNEQASLPLLSEQAATEVRLMLADITPDTESIWRSKIQGIPSDYQNEAILLVARYYFVQNKVQLARFYYKLLDDRAYAFTCDEDYQARVQLGLIQPTGTISVATPTYITEEPKAPTSPVQYILYGAAGASAFFLLAICIAKRGKKKAQTSPPHAETRCTLVPCSKEMADQPHPSAAGYLYIDSNGESFLCALPDHERAYTIGRHQKNDICISNLSISKHNAVLYSDSDGNWSLQDLNSLNKISIDNTKYSHVVLPHKKSFYLGHVQCRYSPSHAAQQNDA